MLWPDRLTFATAGRLIAHTWCESGAHDDEGGGDDHEDHNHGNGGGDGDDNDEMMMMRVGISGRRWGGALRTSVSTKSTASTPLLCLLSPTTPYSCAYYPLLHCLLPTSHYRLSASRCCIHEYDNMGVNHDKRSGYFRPLQFHSPQKLLIMMLIITLF